MPVDTHPDLLIAGAGLVGLALALEACDRGAKVTVLDSRAALGQASLAAAGMLAAQDPSNPPALAPLSKYSVGLYPHFLQRIAALSGQLVPFQTDTTLQYSPDGEVQASCEHSLDPRQLVAALRSALSQTSVVLHEGLGQLHITEEAHEVAVHTSFGTTFQAPRLIHASGAWAAQHGVLPRKGQMLRVQLPPGTLPSAVHRSDHAYAVPRRFGPQAGTLLIGATVEDAGFDLSTTEQDLSDLRQAAAWMLPCLGDPLAAPAVEAWAGLRPTTADLLPVLGPVPGSPHQWVASGHFRNGILLAPGTASVMLDWLLGQELAFSLEPFSPERFRS